MQIVINIPEEVKHKVYAYGLSLCPSDKEQLINAIMKGTPLPKGHGVIGDLDALREEVLSWGMNDYEPSDFVDAIDQADTIIEADKAESEE